MSDRHLILLGISTILAGFAPAVQAQSLIPTLPAPPSQAVTLSSESLGAIEGRNTESNYQDFFSQQGSGAQYEPAQAESSSASFLDNVGIIFGSRINYPEYMEVFNAPAEFRDSQSVQLKLPFAN